MQFQAAYNYINGRQYQQALNVLSRMQNRNAQWYYLSARANMGMGNNVNALNMARQAQSMDPGNPEYANLVNRLQWNSNRYQQGGGYPYANNGGGGCGTGNFCCDMWCADSLCECMGGDCAHACKCKKNSISGLLMALSVVLMILSGILEFSTLFFLAAAAFFVGIIIKEYGLGYGAAFFLGCTVLDFCRADRSCMCLLML